MQCGNNKDSTQDKLYIPVQKSQIISIEFCSAGRMQLKINII